MVARLSGFTVLAPTPTVTGVSPNSALRGTTLYTVNVYGTGFTRGAVVALIGGNDWIHATDEFWISPTQIQCTLAIPENAAHSFYNVGVINPGGPYPNSTIVFYVTAPTPTVTGISPNTAAPDTMGSFYVSGTGFAFGAEVEIRGGTGSATTIGVLGTSRVNSTTLLCTLIIEPGTPPGPYDVFVRNSGGEWVPRIGAFTVLAPPVLAVPPSVLLPIDTDGDGLYDDVNGNGRKDFADVVLYFNQMTWIAANEPVAAFDCNGNGRIDFADVVWLFNNH